MSQTLLELLDFCTKLIAPILTFIFTIGGFFLKKEKEITYFDGEREITQKKELPGIPFP